jgi:hypothetical protein
LPIQLEHGATQCFLSAQRLFLVERYLAKDIVDKLKNVCRYSVGVGRLHDEGRG